MSWTKLLFKPGGRINRAKFWLGGLVNFAAYVAADVPITLLKDEPHLSLGTSLLMLVAAIVVLASLYVGLVLGIKRFHDRNKSGSWILISLVPIVGSIWYLVECGFLRGTVGRNRFGPDPLLPNEDLVAVFAAPESPHR